MTWAITLTAPGAQERTGGVPALVTVNGDQPAVMAPDPAVCSAVYSVQGLPCTYHWHVTCYLMAHRDVIMTASCVRYCHQY